MSDLSDRIRKQREKWVDVRPGKRVKVRRPAEFALGKLTQGVEIEHIAGATVDWEGWTEADFVGDGSSSSLPFDADAWGEYLADHAEDAATVANALVNMISAHFEAREGIGKNLLPASTTRKKSGGA